MSELGVVVDSLEKAIERAAAIRDSNERAVLGIAGPPGAGKTTLATQVVERLNAMEGHAGQAALLPMDGFHHLNSTLDSLGLRNVKGAPATFDVDQYVGLLRAVVQRPEQQWLAPGFSRVTDAPVPGEFVIEPSVRLVVTEGNYLLLDGPWAPIRDLCAETWYVDVDPRVERSRLVERQIAGGKTPEAAAEWVERSDMANAVVIADCKRNAAVVVCLPGSTGESHG